MLRVAVPNKGSLSEAATEILAEAGYRQRRTTKDLSLTDPDNGVEFYYLRPRDIAVYVGEGTLDVGISGRDLVLDSHAAAETILELGFGGSTFRFAGRPGVARSVKDLEGKRIATSFAGILSDHLAENGVKASVVKLDGAVESAVQLGVADVIADVVETGTTLRQAGLEVFGEPILKSEAVLIKRHAVALQPNGLEQLVRRLEGVRPPVEQLQDSERAAVHGEPHGQHAAQPQLGDPGRPRRPAELLAAVGHQQELGTVGDHRVRRTDAGVELQLVRQLDQRVGRRGRPQRPTAAGQHQPGVPAADGAQSELQHGLDRFGDPVLTVQFLSQPSEGLGSRTVIPHFRVPFSPCSGPHDAPANTPPHNFLRRTYAARSVLP